MDTTELLQHRDLSTLVELGRSLRDTYAQAEPFPSIQLDDLLAPDVLRAVLSEFPDLQNQPDLHFETPNEIKRASKGEHRFGPATRSLMHFLNSQPFLEFLSALTGIEALLPDPYFEGGGCHEIMPGGLLKVHADFNKHRKTGLDRRLNVLIYLNEDWQDAYGGHFELWDREMKQCVKRILPVFNRMAVFSTTDFSYHGHPDPLRCPEGRSRRSLALYYYTNGRPAHEIQGDGRHPTLFVYRPEADRQARAFQKRLFDSMTVAGVLRGLLPPVVVKLAERLVGA